MWVRLNLLVGKGGNGRVLFYLKTSFHLPTYCLWVELMGKKCLDKFLSLLWFVSPVFSTHFVHNPFFVDLFVNDSNSMILYYILHTYFINQSIIPSCLSFRHNKGNLHETYNTSYSCTPKMYRQCHMYILYMSKSIKYIEPERALAPSIFVDLDH